MIMRTSNSRYPNFQVTGVQGVQVNFQVCVQFAVKVVVDGSQLQR